MSTLRWQYSQIVPFSCLSGQLIPLRLLWNCLLFDVSATCSKVLRQAISSCCQTTLNSLLLSALELITVHTFRVYHSKRSVRICSPENISYPCPWGWNLALFCWQIRWLSLIRLYWSFLFSLIYLPNISHFHSVANPLELARRFLIENLLLLFKTKHTLWTRTVVLSTDISTLVNLRCISSRCYFAPLFAVSRISLQVR